MYITIDLDYKIPTSDDLRGVFYMYMQIRYMYWTKSQLSEEVLFWKNNKYWISSKVIKLRLLTFAAFLLQPVIFLSISTEERKTIFFSKNRWDGQRKNRDPEKHEKSTDSCLWISWQMLCYVTFVLYSSEQLITELPFNKGFTKGKNLNRLSS